MKCQSLFSGEYMKNNISLSSTEFAERVAKAVLYPELARVQIFISSDLFALYAV